MLVFIVSLALVVVLLLAEMPIAFAFGLGALVFGIASGSDVSFLIPSAIRRPRASRCSRSRSSSWPAP